MLRICVFVIDKLYHILFNEINVLYFETFKTMSQIYRNSCYACIYFNEHNALLRLYAINIPYSLLIQFYINPNSVLRFLKPPLP